MDDSMNHQPALKTLPAPELIAHAELKRQTALLKIMEYLQFTPVPAPLGSPYDWSWPHRTARDKGCVLCCQSHTACHISPPVLRIVLANLWDLSEGLEGSPPKVMLVLGPCERCTFLRAKCDIRGTTLVFRKRWAVQHWELRYELVLPDGTPSRTGIPLNINVRARPAASGPETWIRVPEEITLALWNVLEVSERLIRVEDLKDKMAKEAEENGRDGGWTGNPLVSSPLKMKSGVNGE